MQYYWLKCRMNLDLLSFCVSVLFLFQDPILSLHCIHCLFFLSLPLSAAQWFLSLRIIFLWVLATYFVECTEFGFVGCCLMIRLSFNLFWIVSSESACIICMNEYSKHFLALRNQFGIVGWKVIWKLRSRFWPHLSWWTFCVDFKHITQPVSFRINEFCYVMLHTFSP